MDPDENLEEQLRIIKYLDELQEDGDTTEETLLDAAQESARLAELVQALDEWIVNGGFLPKRWRQLEAKEST